MRIDAHRAHGHTTPRLPTWPNLTAPHFAALQEPLIGFYEAGGFALVGKSDVVHGADPWFEMRSDGGTATAG